MNRTRSKDRIKARISEAAMVDLARDIDAAIADRDVVRLAAFAAEAELTAGMDQQASRAREILALLETAKAKAGSRGELLRLKAALGRAPRPEPDVAAMVRAADAEQVNRGGRFDRTESEILERRRIEEQNKQLAETQRRLEEQRRRRLGLADPEQPWWRR